MEEYKICPDCGFHYRFEVDHYFSGCLTKPAAQAA
jgi:hypothetical protein